MKKIETISAYIAENKDRDEEGIIAARMGGEWWPLVMSDEIKLIDIVNSLKERGHFRDQKIKLVRFSNREER